MRADPFPMVVADPLAAFMKDGAVKVVAPAKTNLFLGIGALRPDGYHDAVTVMHALGLHDVLHFDSVPEDGGGLQIEAVCYAREKVEPLEIGSEDNIAVKAVRLLAEKTGRDEDEKISIRIEKRIPHEAGLGGGSSDAAAALLGAARLWGIDEDAPAVAEAAAALGADVPFFLKGGCALLGGTGGEFERALEPMKKQAVLVKPSQGISTAQAYRLFDENPVAVPAAMLQAVRSAGKAADVPLFNNLSAAAFRMLPELERIAAWVQEQEGAAGSLLCGSGSATVVVCEDFASASRICGSAQAKGWWARTTSFSSLRASVVPK